MDDYELIVAFLTVGALPTLPMQDWKGTTKYFPTFELCRGKQVAPRPIEK